MINRHAIELKEEQDADDERKQKEIENQNFDDSSKILINSVKTL